VKKIHSPVLVNAAEMGREHPETFYYPTKRQLDSIQPGDLVKVCEDSEPFPERFWVIVTKRDGDLFVGAVDNYLFENKPYKNPGALIQFGVENVYNVWEGPE
jgi:hypothetical protein